MDTLVYPFQIHFFVSYGIEVFPCHYLVAPFQEWSFNVIKISYLTDQSLNVPCKSLDYTLFTLYHM